MIGITKGGKTSKPWRGEVGEVAKSYGESLLENYLKSILPQTKDPISFGKANIKTNFKDELINSITEKLFFNRYEEITPSFSIGGSFGENQNWYSNLDVGLNEKGKVGNVGFNIGRSF